MNALIPFLLPVLAPLLVVGLGAGLLSLDRGRLSGRRQWAGAVLALSAVIVSYLTVEGIPPLWPVEASDHAWMAGGVGFMVGTQRQWIRSRPVWFGTGLALLTAVWLRWLVDPLVTWTWTSSEALMWGAGLWLIWTAVWTAGTWLSTQIPDRSMVGNLAVSMGITAMTLAATGSVKLGQLEGGLAVGLAVLAVVGLFWKTSYPVASAAVVAIPTSTVLIGAGVLFSETPPIAGVALALAPLSAWLGQGDQTGFPWRGALAAVLFAGVGLGLALGLSPAPVDPGSYGQY